MEYSNEEKDFLFELGRFLLKEFKEEALIYRDKFNITDINIKNNIVNLTLKRAGSFIGYKGETVTRFLLYLKSTKFKDFKLHLIENNIESYMRCMI